MGQSVECRNLCIAICVCVCVCVGRAYATVNHAQLLNAVAAASPTTVTVCTYYSDIITDE